MLTPHSCLTTSLIQVLLFVLQCIEWEWYHHILISYRNHGKGMQRIERNCSVLLYMQSPKSGCCSISDDLSCSSTRYKEPIFVEFWEHQMFIRVKLTEIVILWVYYTIPFGFSLIWSFLALFFKLFNYFVWPRITDEGSVPEMSICSILFI